MDNNRVQWIQHGGKRILYADYSNLPNEQIPEMIDEVLNISVKEPPNSILYLINVENIRFSTNTLNQFNKMTKQTDPHTKASAIIGVKGLTKIMYDGWAKIFTKEQKTFDNISSRNEALDWLASRP